MLNNYYKIIFIFTFACIILNEEMPNKNSNYSYNLNGRIILPAIEEINKLPLDGGELWNRLIFESSPYLLQHAANPVDWHPWNENSFKLAKELNKPIFLSIGYTTCHWCHVMEHESFEDVEVAKLMNDTFINIKVDREERPDVDNVYMQVTQNLTGRGGWPMTVIMTPDKKPFFAGTYFPKYTRARYNRKGMMDLVPLFQELWKNKQDSLISSANSIVNELQVVSQGKNIKLKDNILERSFNSFNRRFDKDYGGFSSSRNKFPKPHDYSFITKYYYKTKNPSALDIVTKSLYEMKKGGIYDQIGFGFHRYSTDQKWLVPHFEKMLYDQALLIHAYLDAYLVTNDSFFSNTVEEICEYVLRDMVSEDGGFYSAEDADSEGEEGKFYVWDINEIKDVLGKDEFEQIKNILNFKENGNCVVEGNRTNIPHFTSTLKKLSGNNDSLFIRYNDIRKKIFDVRENRVHPQKDDKILTDWNGLMISSLARAAAILNNKDYLSAAKKSADFILENLVTDNGVLLKSFKNHPSKIDGMIEDYSFFIWGLIELYQADFNSKYIIAAENLSDYMIEHFWDKENYAFFFTSNTTEALILRNKEIYDGAIPSGNSVSAYNFIRLGRILSNSEYEDIAYNIVDAFSSQLNRYSSGSSMLLQAINFIEGPSYEVVISGQYKKSKEIINYIHSLPQPNKVLIFKNIEKEESLFPYLDYYNSDKNGYPLVYVCQNYTCKLPTNKKDIISELLK